MITKDSNIKLSNVAWVPKSSLNLISLGALTSRGAKLRVNCNVNPNTFQVSYDNSILLSGSILNNLFVINMKNRKMETTHEAHYSNEELHTIHQTLGHASVERSKKYLNCTLPSSLKDNFECLSCDRSKITQKPFNHVQPIAQGCFEKIHLNLIGPMNTTSKGGFRYILNLVNSHLGYIACFPLKHKSDAAKTLMFIIKNQHRKTKLYPKEVCSDGGGEFVNSKLQTYYRARQINQISNNLRRQTTKVVLA